MVYARGADEPCNFKTNAKIYSQEKMEEDMKKLELLEKKREEPWIFEPKMRKKEGEEQVNEEL